MCSNIICRTLKHVDGIISVEIGSRVNAETQGRLEECNESPKVALSGDSHVIAIGTNGSLYLFSAFSGELLDQVLDIYKGKRKI